jgi:hypothetical protein
MKRILMGIEEQVFLEKFFDELIARVYNSAVVRTTVFSPLSSWIRLSLWIHVKRVSQRSVESRGFSPGAPVSSHRES